MQSPLAYRMHRIPIVMREIGRRRWAIGEGSIPGTIEDPAERGAVLDKNVAKSLVRGESNREKIALTILADRVRELV